MKKKQVVAMIIAAVLFIVICASSMLMNFLTSSGSDSSASQVMTPNKEYVARVDIVGAMEDTGAAGYFSTDTVSYNQEFLINYINQLIYDENNVGLLLYVNSPGGYVTYADELYLKLLDYKETDRPIYCYFSDEACSAAYYISMTADQIYASRMCTTGSIGVYIATYNLSGLFEKYGIEEVIIKSAENKAMGSMGTPWTQEQKDIYQAVIDEEFGRFVDIVAEGRSMDRSKVVQLADGRIYTAQQALDNGLIDGIERYEDYESMVMSHFSKNTELFYGQTQENIFASLLGEMQSLKPKSELQIFQELTESMESGVPKYESTY